MSWQIRLISVERKSILAMRDFLQEEIATKRSALVGVEGSEAAAGVCALTDMTAAEDLVGKMAGTDARRDELRILAHEINVSKPCRTPFLS